MWLRYTIIHENAYTGDTVSLLSLVGQGLVPRARTEHDPRSHRHRLLSHPLVGSTQRNLFVRWERQERIAYEGRIVMELTYACCCGLDVHKRTVVACLLSETSDGPRKEIRTFSTMTIDLLTLADLLTTHGCTHVAMESTGVYWKPVYNLLEGLFEILVVNAQHLKAVPGRKTDIKDAEWIATLLQHGLLHGSFVPSIAQRELRDLTRHRQSLVHERVRLVNRLQKVLEDANIKLAGIATDITGVSARVMLAALVAGEADPGVLAQLAQGRLQAKRALLEQALAGRCRSHHRFLLAEHLSHLDYLDAAIARFGAELVDRLRPDEELIALLDTIPSTSLRYKTLCNQVN